MPNPENAAGKTPGKTETITSWTPFDMGDLVENHEDKPAEPKAEPKADPKADPKAGDKAQPPRGEVEKPKSPEKITPAAKQDHPRGLVRAAVNLGIAEADAEAMSAEDLQDAMTAKAIEARVLREEHARQSASTRTADAADKAGMKAEANGVRGIDTSKVDLGVAADKLDMFDDDLVAVLKRMQAQIDGLLEQNKNLLADAGRRAHQEKMTVAQKLDALFTARPDTFGTMTVDKIAPNTREFARRQAVITQMNRLEAAGAKGGIEELFAEACEYLGYSGAPAKAEPAPAKEQQARDEIGRWAKGGVARPTDRTDAPETDPTKRAERKVEERAERNGLVVNGTASLDDFPD